MGCNFDGRIRGKSPYWWRYRENDPPIGFGVPSNPIGAEHPELQSNLAMVFAFLPSPVIRMVVFAVNSAILARFREKGRPMGLEGHPKPYRNEPFGISAHFRKWVFLLNRNAILRIRGCRRGWIRALLTYIRERESPLKYRVNDLSRVLMGSALNVVSDALSIIKERHRQRNRGGTYANNATGEIAIFRPHSFNGGKYNPH